MRRTIRLTVRQHRFGFAMLGLTTLALAIGCIFIAWLAFGPYEACKQSSLPPNPTQEQMAALEARCMWLAFPVQVGTEFILFTSAVVPIIGALLLAVSLIALELELGTATLSWGLARNRRAWLLPRMGLVLAATLAVGILAALTSDAVTGQVFINGSPWASLYAYDSRGAIIVARVLLVTSAGLFAGALLGRQMPALVVAGAIAFGVGIYITGQDHVLNQANEVVLARSQDGSSQSSNDLYLEDRIQDIATGELVGWDQFPYGMDPTDPVFQAKYRYVSLGIPALEAANVVARNVVFYAVPSILLLGLTLVVVERRRPYLS